MLFEVAATVVMAASPAAKAPISSAHCDGASGSLVLPLRSGDTQVVAGAAGLRLVVAPAAGASASASGGAAASASAPSAASVSAPAASPAPAERACRLPGKAGSLVLGRSWSVLDGTGVVRTAVKLPAGLHRPKAGRCLGATGQQVWVALPGGIAGVDVAAGTVRYRRLGSSSHQPQLLRLDGTAGLTTVFGKAIIHCTAELDCHVLSRLPAAVKRILAGPGGWLLAVAGRRGGLFRLAAADLVHPFELAAGSVEALCRPRGSTEAVRGLAGEAWAAIERGGRLHVVDAATQTPALRFFAPEEAVAYGLAAADVWPDAATVIAALTAALAHHAPVGEDLAVRAALDPRPAVRRAAADALASLTDPRSTAALWQLADDSSDDVRLDALSAARERCSHTTAAMCIALLDLFTHDSDTDIAWSARDALLLRDPRRAFADAPAAYKIGALSKLSLAMERGGVSSVVQAIRLLMTDPNPTVRLEAQTVLNLARPQ